MMITWLSRWRHLVKRGILNVPVVGVARSDCAMRLGATATDKPKSATIQPSSYAHTASVAQSLSRPICDLA